MKRSLMDKHSGPSQVRGSFIGAYLVVAVILFAAFILVSLIGFGSEAFELFGG